MIKISICICTRKRQKGLTRLLSSLENLEIPANSSVKILVVENDLKNYSEDIVREWIAKSKFELRYYLECQQGLVFARNRSVKEAEGSDFCCFVDDDQVVAADWLIELIKCQVEFNSDGVWGANPPVFNKEVPSYIRQFYRPDSFLFDYGAIVHNAYTNCLLLKKNILDKFEEPFDLRLNFSGGEDIYLTSQISKLGGIIRNNPKAIAYEIISESRTSIKYILKRCYRNSNTAYFVQSLGDINSNKFEIFIRLIMRLIYGFIIIIPIFIFGKPNRLKGFLKIIDAIGGFSFLLGKRNQFYK
jgi:succinoglycan biosynthesis protein ExoM